MLRDRLRSQRAPLLLHLAVLAVGLIVLSGVATREWFFYDDWYYVTQQTNIVWAPHVGHWSTIPVLLFLAIQSVFGMDHYLPFAVPAILAHLGVVHLVWRIMVRVGVRPWMATAFSVLLTFLGAGAEAIDWAVQIGFVGAIVGLLGTILLLDAPRLGLRRGVLVAMIVTASLACSEVALPFIIVAVVLAWRRFGLPRTIAVFSMPFVALLVWYLLVGRTDPGTNRAGTLAQLLQVPQFAVAMLTDGVGRMFPVAVIGGLIFVAVAVWWIFTLRTGWAEPTRLAYGLFVAAPVFAVLTGYSRIANGLSTATSSRYVYVVVIAMAPLLALQFDRVTRSLSLVPAVSIVLILALWNAGGLAIALHERIQRAESTAAQLAATAAAITHHPGCLASSVVPSPQWAPNVRVGDVQRWLREGWYHPASVPAAGVSCPH